MLLVSIALVTVVLDQHWVAANRFCSNDPHPPYCADDCSGNSFYLSQDGTRCLQCPTCQPGNELNKLCGNGRNGDAQCVPCEDGFFSANRARRCMQCRACTNTVELKACERTSDRECGDCLPGYLRSWDRFGDPNACPLRCRDHSPDTPGCEEWWREQNEGETGGVVANEDKPANEAPMQEYDDELCESEPPQCEDDCHGNRLYLGQDGLCKLCLQCQPGYELDKDCGNGVNGDAKCQRCQEGTFSIDGRGPCIPCRICVNTEELSRCEPTSDRECGECLPGFFQAAKGFFPDPNACPNSCAENPRDTPECLEWWQQQDAVVTDMERPQTNMDPGKVPQPLHDKEEPVVFHAEESQDTKFAKVGSPSTDHTSHMTVITALASLLIVVVIGAVLALVALKIYPRRRNHKVITNTEGRLLNSSGNSTPDTATPDMAHLRSSPRIYKESPVQQEASSLTNKPQFWEKIHHSHVQGADPYLINQNEAIRTGSRRPNSVHHGTESIQPSHASDRRTRRYEGPLPPWEPRLQSTTGSYDGKEDEVLYSSDGNGTTHSVSENSTEGTRLRRRSSLLSPPTQDGIQVLRRNSIQLNHLANKDTNPSDERRKLIGDGEGQRDYLNTARKEPEAALFPKDSPDEADGKGQLKGPRDIEQGRNAQYNSFHNGQTTPHLGDRDINTEACNSFKTNPNLPHQIEEGPLRKASQINNRKKTPAVGLKQRSQHPQNTSLTITSESPVININVRTPKVTKMQVGDEYNEHHYGTQDALLRSDEDDEHTPDRKDDESDEEEDQLLHNT